VMDIATKLLEKIDLERSEIQADLLRRRPPEPPTAPGAPGIPIDDSKASVAPGY
jgi:hypothetical protein